MIISIRLHSPHSYLPNASTMLLGSNTRCVIIVLVFGIIGKAMVEGNRGEKTSRATISQYNYDRISLNDADFRAYCSR